ncbi:MAG: ERCC4 domain-containing protein [bacterium]
MASRASSPIIVIDTREQRAYSFNETRVGGVVHTALPAGDYSLQGCEMQIAIERKSLPDYINTVIHSPERFRRELALLKTYPRAWIVVEGSLDDLLQGRYDSQVLPQSLLAITAALMTQYQIPVLFAGDRPSARALVEELLLQWHAHHTERKGI